MTVAVATRYQNFLGNDTTGPFSFSFPILLSNAGVPYITVTQIDALGANTTLSYPGDYSFTPLKLGKAGGTITTTTAVPDDGSRLFVQAVTPLDQGVAYSNQGDFFPETHEGSYDKIHYILIENAAKSNLSIAFPSYETGTENILPNKTLRANTTLCFDANGDILCGAVATAPVSAAMIPVVASSTLALARTNMGIVNPSSAMASVVQAASLDDARTALNVFSKAEVYTTGDMDYAFSIRDDAINLLGNTFRNMLVNGNMRISQRYGTTPTVVSGTVNYSLDRWRFSWSQASKLQFTQQSSSAIDDDVPYHITISSASSYSVVDGDYFNFQQHIEADVSGRLMMGTANASSSTLSFWAMSNRVGTYAVSLMNTARNRSCVKTYTINSASTWEKKTLTFPGDTSGTWVTTGIGLGLTLSFDLGCGSTYNAGSADTWVTGEYYTVAGTTKLVNNSGDYMILTNVQLEPGTHASRFERLPYNVNLSMCERYYRISNWVLFSGNVTSGSTYYTIENFEPMRSSPSSVITDGGSNTNFPATAPVLHTANAHCISIYKAANGTGAGYFTGNITLTSEL